MIYFSNKRYAVENHVELEKTLKVGIELI